MESLPGLIIFGPQNSCPAQDFLAQTRLTLLTAPFFTPFLQTVTSLPSFWQDLQETSFDLQRVPGLRILTALRSWIETGVLHISKDDEKLNILLTPLTVIVHFSQYIQCMSHYEDSQSQSLSLGGFGNVHIKPNVQGFCTGLLAASAVACTDKLSELSTLASVCLKLAVYIGASVDSDGKFAEAPEQDETTCLVVSWKTEEEKDRILKILEENPREAYISVVKSPSSFTLTVTKSHGLLVSQKLSASGILPKPIFLEGRFHTRRHESVLTTMKAFCNSRTDLQLPDSSKLLVPLRSSVDGSIIADGAGVLHDIVLGSILVEMCNWDCTITAAVSDLSKQKSRNVVVLAQIDCLPRGLVRDYGLKVQQLWENPNTSSNLPPPLGSSPAHPLSPDAIAIVGMACRFPGAASVEDFWTLLASGNSMVSGVPPSRFSTKSLRRTLDIRTQYWGNFLNDAESFDHKFFKKSPREAVSMDPQQRVALEIAYEALESSGYFDDDQEGTNKTKSIGVYLGVGSVDYQDNVTSHMPTAFSALGTLRAFISGKISHYFGWTGPSITYDTACSSSAVAIHSACKAIQSGECEAAVAGGVNVITSPVLFQNLSAASFLSPSGASKAFDSGADGYCRGEGCAIFVLKKLSSVTTRDEVLAVIAGSAVNQSDNCSPITVPHSSSQSNLYRQVAALSKINPHDVGYVEAHGTGTPVGDPIEASSIRQVFGGPERKQKLWLGSVKGNIGHLEAASGAAALVKSVLMIQKASIPKQASFVSLNPRIPPLSPDNMEIAGQTRSWDSDFRAVCINNYGAAGSNAALIVCQPPPRLPHILSTQTIASSRSTASKELFHLTANSNQSLKSFCSALQHLINQAKGGPESTHLDGLWLGALAFNLAHKQNHTLGHSLITTSDSPTNLWNQLEEVKLDITGRSLDITQDRISLPVILCFGGQTSISVGLSKELYDTCAIFRMRLDECDKICRYLSDSLATTIYPYIFSQKPIGSIACLHCSLFALQYSCARAWIDSGVPVASLVGHSFGQLTALCISGVLSLKDSLTFISARASLIQEHWGSEKGSMISIEEPLETVQKIISLASARGIVDQLEIACHNGPKSFVLVGSDEEIDIVQTVIADPASNLGDFVSTKKLQVSHGFHSRFVDAILPGLLEVSKNFIFHEAKIPIETCSEEQNWTSFKPEHLATHSRKPVFFEAAVRRVEGRLGPSIWLEAGSASTITSMARKALGKPSSQIPPNLFLAGQLNGNDAVEQILNTTIDLRKARVHAQYWPYHHSQRPQYQNINLPPYQFEKYRHWLDYKDIVEKVEVIRPPSPDATFEGLMRFVQYQDSSQLIAEFEVNPLSQTFKVCADGHAVLGNSLCPVSLYIEIVSTAVNMREALYSSDSLLRIEDLKICFPLGVDDGRSCHLKLTRSDMEARRWTFVLFSRLKSRSDSVDDRQHATGTVITSALNDPTLIAEKTTYQRLIGPHRCKTLLSDNTAESMRGSLIYSCFDRVVNYRDYYRGVKNIAAKDGEVSGVVCMPASSASAIKENLCNPLAIDSFLQVAGLHVNSLREVGNNEIFVCTSIRSSQLYGDLSRAGSKAQSWMVYSNFEIIHEKLLENDIFVFDSENGSLVMAFLGVQFSKLLTGSFKRALSSVNASKSIIRECHARGKMPQSPKVMGFVAAETVTKNLQLPNQVSPRQPAKVDDTLKKVKMMLSSILDMPVQDIPTTAYLKDLGIDSLMTNEILVDVRRHFGIDIMLDHFQNITTILSFSEYLQLKTINCGYMKPSSSDTTYFSDDSGQIATAIPDLETPLSRIPQSFRPNAAAGNGLSESLAKLLSEYLDLPEFIPRDLNLNEVGLDSLLWKEVQSDIEKEFGVLLSLDQRNLTFKDLLDIVSNKQSPMELFDASSQSSRNGTLNTPREGVNVDQYSTPLIVENLQQPVGLQGIMTCFAQMEFDYERCASLTRQTGFYSQVYPRQAQLVTAYVLEAFEKLGCPLTSMKPGEPLKKPLYSPTYENVMVQIYKVLEDSGVIMSSPSGGFLRTPKQVNPIPSITQHKQLQLDFPDHTSEHNLLNVTGSKLAECLSGNVDPLHLIFGSKPNKDLLEDVYTNSPMFATGTLLLNEFIVKLLHGGKTGSGPVRILEVGGGTCGTTKAVLETLTTLGIQFEYCFTDISASLVHGAKRKFAHISAMDFKVLDIEREPPQHLLGSFHLVISTNCIHATKCLVKSTSNIHKMLRDDGVLCMLELTKNLPWFDLVFGLLDGWWRFEDGRTHALADERLWVKSLMGAGFTSVNWTKGASEESRQLRLIIACKSKSEVLPPLSQPQVETITYGETGGVSLLADVYYPAEADPIGLRRPVALMIHGGGHIMLSRRDIRPSQTQLLLDQGLLPVSIDYRLCPEVTLPEGPMEDACSALRWAQETLPTLSLKNRTIYADGSKIVAVGWSTGGQLAMSLAWTAPKRGIRPPRAILAFYCPTDYEADFWKKPNIPNGTKAIDGLNHNIWEGFQNAPITQYNVPASKQPMGGWLSLSDPRSRIALHMNWTGQSLPILLGRMKSDQNDRSEMLKTPIFPQPATEEITPINPRAQITGGTYQTPTYLVHGTCDDLIPWQQTGETYKCLVEAQISAGVSIIPDTPHLFDLRGDIDGYRWSIVRRAYEFLVAQLR